MSFLLTILPAFLCTVLRRRFESPPPELPEPEDLITAQWHHRPTRQP